MHEAGKHTPAAVRAGTIIYIKIHVGNIRGTEERNKPLRSQGKEIVTHCERTQQNIHTGSMEEKVNVQHAQN